MSDIPEWALREACKRLGERYGEFAIGRLSVFVSKAIRVCASLIAEHEEPPVDPLYEALKSVVELGRYDTREQTELLRGALKSRGLKIVEADPQP